MRNRSDLCLAALTALVFAGACESGTTERLVADAAPSPGELTFRISYQASDPAAAPDEIFLVSDCSPSWIRVLDANDNDVQIHSDCGVCSCDDCDACAVCGCAFLVEPLAQQGSRDHEWNGMVHPVTNDLCGFTCRTAEPLAAGAYTARFCYTLEDSGTDLHCVNETFDFPLAAGIVEHVVTGADL
jgi:hypothetical protein